MKEKGFVHLGVIIVFILTIIMVEVFLSVGGFEVKPYQFPSLSPTTSPAPTQDKWRGVTGKYWKFSIPSSWKILKCTNIESDYILFAGETIEFDQEIDCGFDISPGSFSVVRTSRNLDSYPNKENSKIGFFITESKEIIVGGKQAILQREKIQKEYIEIGDANKDIEYIQVYTEGENYFDIITFSTKENIEILSQILSTFEFVDIVTKEEAERIVRDLPEVQELINRAPNYVVVAEKLDEKSDSWMVHVYESLEDHVVTFNRYYINQTTGEITNI